MSRPPRAQPASRAKAGEPEGLHGARSGRMLSERLAISQDGGISWAPQSLTASLSSEQRLTPFTAVLLSLCDG